MALVTSQTQQVNPASAAPYPSLKTTSTLRIACSVGAWLFVLAGIACVGAGVIALINGQQTPRQPGAPLEGLPQLFGAMGFVVFLWTALLNGFLSAVLFTCGEVIGYLARIEANSRQPV